MVSAPLLKYDYSTANLPRRGHILLHQERRNRQYARNIIKPMLINVVCDQEGAVLNVEREKISYRVGVFGSAHPVERYSARVRVGSRGIVEGCL